MAASNSAVAPPIEEPPPYSSSGSPPSSSNLATRLGAAAAPLDDTLSPEEARVLSPPLAPSTSPRIIRSNSPPPTYQPGPSSAYSPTALRPDEVEKQDRRILKDTLRAHPWRRTWGSPPRTVHEALCRTALLGKREMLVSLLAAGVEVRYTTRYSAKCSSSAVHEALRGPAPELALLLLDECFDRTARRAGVSCSARAEQAALEQVRWLLEARDAQGCTPLHLAAAAGETALAEELLWRGAEVDPVDNFQRTPLHMAARYGRDETIRVLLERGADAGKVREELWRGNLVDHADLGSFPSISRLLQGILLEMGDFEEALLSDTPDHLEESAAIPGRSRQMQSVRAAQSAEKKPSRLVELGSYVEDSLYKGPKKKGVWRPRKAPDSLLSNPLYLEWRAELEKLRAEHQAQKERNQQQERSLFPVATQSNTSQV